MSGKQDVIQAIKELGLEISENQVSESFFDLGLDSLDTLEIVMTLEDKLSIEIPDEEAEKFTCPKDLIEYVESLK